ncbi:glycosyltransferase family 4 protein [Methylobacter sp.]|uniref:glycosyltransferase family 4 protein n=1 Tax=Methylobacter sp. TaxID=2051955 RepID=UPI0025CE9EF9|nr:glycosyltransferase family 4 protein [Methylobacter sp.]
MDKKIVMLSTLAPGGMFSVTEGYRRDGVFERWNIDFIATHLYGPIPEKIREFVKAFFHVFMLLLQGRVALLHCHVSMGLSFWRKSVFLMLGRCFGVPGILHLHGSETKEFYNSLSTFTKRLASHQFTAAATVLVLSDSWRSFVLEVAPKANVVVLPNYVEIPEPVSRTKHSPNINVLFLGVLGERKGVYDLLPAFAAAVKNMPQLFLRIGGNGEVEKTRALVHKLGLETHVECLGWVGGNAKNELLREADIFVLPSYNEGLPVSILEAMSLGIPVITTPVGGIPEVVKDHVNGFLISPGDIPALQNLLEQLGSDPAMRDLIGSAARLSIQGQYSKEIILPKLSAVYEKYVSALYQENTDTNNQENTNTACTTKQ